MAKENVVSHKDVGADGKTREVLLDVNNGYVYDKAGNQIERWQPTSNEHSAMLADFAAAELLEITANAAGSAIHLNPDRRGEALEKARSIRMSGWEGRSVAMDLGPADVHIAAPLPNYASGYKNEQPIADMYAPAMLVDKQQNTYYEFDKKDAFQRTAPTVGSSDGAVAEVSPRFANSTYLTQQYSLGGFVTTEVEANSDAPLRIRQATMRRVINSLVIEREIRAAALATTAGTWDSSVVQTLLAAAKWNGGASSDPILDLHTRMETSWGVVTGIIMSERTYNAFTRNAAVQKYFSTKSSAAPIPDPGQMSALLRLPPIYVGQMRYINSANALDYIWGNDVVLVRQPSEMPPTTQDDVASALTFRWNQPTGQDGQASNGMIVREFFVQDRGSQGGNKVVLVHHDIEKQTSKFVGGLIKAAYQ